MGLDTSHDAWHGGYMSFLMFRDAVAIAGGWKTTKDGYVPSRPWEDIVRDMNNDPHALGHWTTKPADPLEFLLCHQDCDGEIEHEDIEPLLGALRPLVDKIHPEWKSHLEQFIRGLEAANAEGEALKFS